MVGRGRKWVRSSTGTLSYAYTQAIYIAYTQSCSVTKPVQLSDEAYRRLRMNKRPDESFSDVVLRVIGRGSLAELRGLRTPAEIRRAEREISRIDRLDRPRRRRIL